MHWYLEVLRKYAVFGGRARRQEYWMFVLINLIVTFALGFISGIIGGNVGSSGYSVLVLLYSLIVLLPSVAVGVRRLHDTGRSGWWLLIALIPLLGAIILIVFMVQDSEPRENQYGPNPKESLA